ncbi:hypothetical protein [Paenibacillus bouchesdurhonensis]|uniref:hypothetical protein n=1 Tax=Paenibacillus bouchesdurhonensis TaxID=1870990 RepID=UPI000DA5F70C|nr:hypothetical protein [Paenibacillus bouchesdurhonensis]
MHIAIFVMGIFLVVLSGLEKIIIYLTLSNKVGDIVSLKVLVPNYIWLITNLTFAGGVLMIIVSLYLYYLSMKKKNGH